MEADTEQRILRRIWLLEHLPALLGELSYHREHRDFINLPKQLLWVLDTEVGRREVT